MMTKTVDIKGARTESLALITDTEARAIAGKGWSLSFVYSFQEMRDVFNAFRRCGQIGTVAEFSKNYVSKHIPYVNRPWDENGRRLLEIKNALINFELMDKWVTRFRYDAFDDVEPGAPLTEQDLATFRRIFFGYFRFKEYASLLISPTMTTEEKLALTEEEILGRSSVLYYYASARSRVDSFFYALNRPDTIWKFPTSEKNGEVKGGFVRFWDLFLSWGSQLGLIERLNMRRQGYLLSDGKTFSACYFISPRAKADVRRTLEERFKRQAMVDLSDLVMAMCMDYRCSIDAAQEAVIDYYQRNMENVSLIRTSEIFIKETELNKNDRILYPKYKGSFISHIKIRGL